MGNKFQRNTTTTHNTNISTSDNNKDVENNITSSESKDFPIILMEEKDEKNNSKYQRPIRFFYRKKLP